ncbi:MAG: PQQ-binding-like beta-propeller repeat protein [Planctomycetota bacterium]|nr:PQQ-binding-like beta-propeller repeat protein [Planctomycetota bacterium]
MTRGTLQVCLTTVAFVATTAGVLAGSPSNDPLDWTFWRGPEMNGVSRETGLVDEWDPGKGKNVLWQRDDLGGRSTPIVMNGKVYMTCRHNPFTKQEQEKIVCLDAKTGKTLWENIFNIFLSDVPDTRVAWSSPVGDPTTGHVFALGVCGYFQCVDGDTGKTIWSHSLSEEYGLLSTYGGRTNFPIVYEDYVIISAIVIGWGEMAKPAHRFIAFDKRNGQPVWFEQTRLLPYDTTYSSPALTVVNGQAQLVFASGDGGVHGFQPRTGKSIWKYDVSRRGINTPPLIVGNMAFCGHSEENIDSTKMGALFAVDVTNGKELWRVSEWLVGKSQPVLYKDRLYAAEDSGTLLIVDPKTGKKLDELKLGGPVRASPLVADGKLYIMTENCRWWTLKPGDNGLETVFRGRFRTGGCYATPIVSHGNIFVRTTENLFCIGVKDKQPSAEKIPSLEQEADVAKDQKPAHLQVVPCETLFPADKNRQQFHVRLYNANGQWLKTVPAKDVEFSIDGPGTINADGEYRPPAKRPHAAVTVNAKIGDLVGNARIRIVPDLDWNFDFSDGEVPVTWVGARYRNIPLDFDFLKSTETKSAIASQLYIYLQSSFVNSGRPALKFADDSPQQVYSALLRFLGLLQNVTTLEQSKVALDPALELLKQEKFIDGWVWSTWGEAKQPQLVVKKGTRKIDGNGVMVKVKTIPKGTRSQAWMGHTTLQNFTIQADVQAAKKDDKMPDVGLIGPRYTLDLMGASQQLQIRTWPTQLYMAKTVPFAWEPNTWYTMKLRSEIIDGKAVLKGKVWKRDSEEPKAWLVEAVHDIPNLSGSPGLFGNAKDAEIFYDNISVTKNK